MISRVLEPSLYPRGWSLSAPSGGSRSWARPLWLALVLAASLAALARPAEATPSTCEELVRHAKVRQWAQRIEDKGKRVFTDATARGWPAKLEGDALDALDSRHREIGARLLIVAVDLPLNAPLVEATCALGRLLELEKVDTLIVASRFGLHAYAPSLGYSELRSMARAHNRGLPNNPARATLGFTEAVFEASEARRGERNLLGLIGVICVALGIAALLLLALRSRRAPTSSIGNDAK